MQEILKNKYGHSAFHHLCWVPVRVGVGCANLSPLGSSDAHGAHVGNSFFLPLSVRLSCRIGYAELKVREIREIGYAELKVRVR